VNYDEIESAIGAICAPLPESRKLRDRVLSELQTHRAIDARIAATARKSEESGWVLVPEDAVQLLRERTP
jgi:hypothetical protein